MKWSSSIGALLAAGLLALAGCPGDDGSSGGDAAPPEITGGEISLPLSIARDDPVLTGLYFSDPRLFSLARCIGLPLVRSDSAGVLSPGLAASWESPDYISWTFQLDALPGRQDEPGYSARLFDQKLRSVLSGEEASLRAQLADLIDGAAAYAAGTAPDISGLSSDGGTLEIKLTRKFAQFPLWLSQPGLHLIPANPFAEAEPDGASQPAAFAAFTVTEISDNAIRLDANPDNLRGEALLEAVKFVLEPDRQRQTEMFLAGELDAANLPGEQLDDLDPATGEVVKLESAAMILGYFNLSHFPWQDSQFQSKLGLRQAVNYGLNLGILAEETDASFAPWPHFLPEEHKSFIPAGLIRQPTYPVVEKLEEARAALRAADHWQGSHLIPGMDLSYLEYQNLDGIAVSILEFWNDISVSMRPHQTTMEDLRVRVGLGTHEIILYRHAPAYPDPGALAYPLLYSEFAGLGGNWLMLEDAEVDQLIEDTQAAGDEVLREKKFQQLCEHLEDNALLVFIGYATPSIAVSSRLGGLELGAYDFDASLPGQDFSAIGLRAE